MVNRKILLYNLSIFFLIQNLTVAQGTGTVSGFVRADSSRVPLQFVNVALIRQADSAVVTGTVTNDKGSFQINNVQAGEYHLKFTLLGYVEKKSVGFKIDSQYRAFNAGTVFLKEAAVNMNEVTVTSQRPLFNTAIDRKVYNVQQDILSKTGSVSDLLRNIPSVQVDVDGTVSLRGSTNVQILVDGKPSPLMAGGSADVLQQIPANSVEKIEVITNPSAKFKPEGTSGIINIVMKRDANLGLNGNTGANIGNGTRYNINANGNFKPGNFNIFGTYSFRQDQRFTYTSNNRQLIDPATNNVSYYDQNGRAFAYPFTHFATLGFDYRLDTLNTLGLSGNYRQRGYTSHDTTTYLLTDGNSIVSSNYDRQRIDYDKTIVSGAKVYYQRNFVKDDHTLRFEGNLFQLFDQEDNHFTNVYRAPSTMTTFDNRLLREYNSEGEFTADYHNKLSEYSILEAGYDGTFQKDDFPFSGTYFDTTRQALVTDTSMTDHFIYKGSIHALYATYQTTFGAFNALGGLRAEDALITSDLTTLATIKTIVPIKYFKLYPTLHLAYKLSEFNELQLNYSLRVNRPNASDLNPFPEAQDPRNLRAGNPHLLPEYIHSIEFGYQLQNDGISLVPSIFYRKTYNGFTTVTRSLNDSTLLTTQENLLSDQSGGLELVITADLWNVIALNMNANAFYQQIDATNLGYSNRKSTVSWNGALNCNINLAKGTMVQVNSNYRSLRLTPQGEIRPIFVLNLGFRQDLFDKQISLIATASDILHTLNRKTDLNNPWLTQNSVLSRDSRIVFIGLTYHFGIQPKRSKDKPLQYDDNN